MSEGPGDAGTVAGGSAGEGPGPDLGASDLSLPVQTYLRLRGLKAPGRRRRRQAAGDDEDQPFTSGRDPRGIGDVVADLTRESGWDGTLAREDLVLRWRDVAGEETAAHAEPIGMNDGTLLIRCDSTAWAKQLSLLRPQLLSSIVRAHPDAGVQALRFIGPDVPSWKRGFRTAPGRGPRDTYG